MGHRFHGSSPHVHISAQYTAMSDTVDLVICGNVVDMSFREMCTGQLRGW